MTERIHADICIIGAGSGGLSVAAAAAQMGARTVLIEGGEMGGDCLNRGCVPSKALIAMAARGAGYDKAMAHVAATIAAIAPHDSQQRFEGLGVRVIRAWGRFTSPRDVAAGECLINARRFVIATGTAPVVPDIPGLAAVPFLTTDTIWSLRERPDHLLILGAGPVGLELAQAHRRLGAKVTVIEAASALGREDADLAAQVLAALRAEGIEIREGIHVTGVAGTAGAIKVELADGQAIHGTDLLVATGRKARTERLNLAAAGIETGAHGILTDTALRTTSRRIFAIGDVAGRGAIYPPCGLSRGHRHPPRAAGHAGAPA